MPPDARNLSDRELLVLTYVASQDAKEAIERIEHKIAVMDNRLAVAETRIEERTDPKRAQTAGIGGVIGALVSLVTVYVKSKMGV